MPTDSKRTDSKRTDSKRTQSSRGARNGSSSAGRDERAQPAELARNAARLISELTGRRAESVLGLRRDGDGWKVTVEVVELSRVPNSTDLLGSYLVALDDEGELLGYERLRRYPRGQAGGEEQ